MAEEQAVFRPGRGTIELIFSLSEVPCTARQRTLLDLYWFQESLWSSVASTPLESTTALWNPSQANQSDWESVQENAKCYKSQEWYNRLVPANSWCLTRLHFVSRLLQHLSGAHYARGTWWSGEPRSRTINNLCFADDIGLLTQLLKHAQVLLDRVDKVSSKYGQVINDSKTEWILISTKSEWTEKNRKKEGLLLRGKELQHMERFKYLGTTLTANFDCSTDIRIRTAMVWKWLSNLDNIWKNKNIKNETKMRLYRSPILPIALYGCDAWTLTVGVLKRNNYLYWRWQHLENYVAFTS